MLAMLRGMCADLRLPRPGSPIPLLGLPRKQKGRRETVPSGLLFLVRLTGFEPVTF